MLNKRPTKQILDHANECYPRECCGLLLKTKHGKQYYPCENIAQDNKQFEINPKDYIMAEMHGEVIAIVHSHPDGSTKPSVPDRVQMNLGNIPWVITNGTDIDIHKPDAYTAPLLGRSYYHGIMDCYTLWKDYYRRELGITMSDYDRKDLWWENKDSPSLYLDNYEKEGFVQVQGDPQKHDVILCRLGRTEHVNHTLIFVGDAKLKSEQTTPVIGNDLVLHHPYNRKSIREIYGQNWQKRTHCILRHKSLIK